MEVRVLALALAALMIVGLVGAPLAEAKGKPDGGPGRGPHSKDAPSPPGQERRPQTPPGHEHRPSQTPSGTIPATPATPAEPHPGEGPATPATPATPAQPAHKQEEEEGPLGFDVYPDYVWWLLTPYPIGTYNNIYPGAENMPGSWPITITAWENNYTAIDLYFAGTDFYSWYGYTFSITNLWLDDDPQIYEEEETGIEPYQLQNEFSEEPVIEGLEPGESVDIYFYLSFPEDQPIVDYWAWLYIEAEPSQ